MLRKSKLINIICSMLLGVVFILAVMAVLVVTGVLSVGKTELTFVTPSVEALYDGMPLTNHNWELKKGTLKKGHELKVECKGTQTAVGESKNDIEVKIVDELGADVTGDYDIKYDFGTLKVNPRSLIITSASATKTYDGSPLTAPKYEISADCDGLVKGHKESVIVTGFIIEPGQINNLVFSSAIYDEVGNDVTGNYKIVIREGLLVINPEQIDGGSGGGEEPGGETGEGGEIPDFGGSSSLLPSEGNEDVVLFQILSEQNGIIYLKTQSFGDYNGKGWADAPSYSRLINMTYSASYLPSVIADQTGGRTTSLLKIKSLHGMYALPYYMSGKGNYQIQTSDVLYVGDTENEYSVYYYPNYLGGVTATGSLASYEANYRNFVYKNYLTVDSESRAYMENLIMKQGFSATDPDIISKVASYIQNAAKYNLKYNSALDNESNIAIAFLETYKEGVCRHYASAATLLFRTLGIPARYTVGVSANAVKGAWTDVKADRAHAWVEVYINGIGWVCVEVTGSSGGGQNPGQIPDSNNKLLTVYPKEIRKKYDGKILVAQNELAGFEDYAALGYTYEAVVKGSRTEPGITRSVIESLIIRDPSGEDVTDSIPIIKKEGIVQVYLDVINCSSNSYEKVYDGNKGEFNVICDNYLSTDFKITFISTFDGVNTGNYQNTFNVTAYNSKSENVTDQYWIRKTYGKIVVEPREVTFKAGDAEKVYDGSPLTCEEIDLVSGILLEGHMIKAYTVLGTQTEIGRSENIITYIEICDSEGNDVTSNYSIKLLAGLLKVKFR